MLVCPQCRIDNLEDARFCRACGRSLEAVGIPLRRPEGVSIGEGIDLPPARKQSVWPAILLGVLVLVGGAAWFVWSAVRPDPCDGKFASAQYPYCVQLTGQWSGGLAPEGDEIVDRFIHNAVEAQADVQIEQVLDPSVTTAQYAQQFRTSLEAEGLDPEPAIAFMLDGEQAVSWNYSLAGAEGEPPIRLQEVVIVRPEGAWRITLTALDEAQTQAINDFNLFLDSWRWRS